MGRGLSRAASLIEGFNGMYDAIGRVQRDRELAQVASAMPTMDEGFTPDQGAQLKAAANSGQYDITWDPEAKGYRVTAKADPASSGVIKQGERQTFLGQVQNTPLDEAGVSRARNLAMAGVLERTGDIEGGQRMRDRVEAGDDRKAARARAAKLEARDDERWRRDQEGYDADKAYREGMQGIIDGSVFGQRSKAFQESMSKYEAEKKAYDAKVAAGDTSGIAPTMPAQPTMTSAEKLLDAANVISFRARHGKATPEEIMKLSDQMTALGQEGYTNMLRMAQSGAPLTAVVQAFNSTGKAQIDPQSIVKDERVKREGGVESRLITYRLPDGRTQTIDTYAELTGLGKAAEVLDQAKTAHQQRMAEGQLAVSQGNLQVARGNLAVHQADSGRRAAEFQAGAPGREAAAEIARLRIALAKTEDPAEQKKLQEKLQALSTGTRGAAAQAADPVKEREARALVASGAAPDMETAREAVNGRGEKVFQSYVDKALRDGATEEAAVERAKRLMRATGHEERSGRWVKTGFPGVTPPQGAIEKLRKNPDLAAKFDEKYGKGAAARVLTPSEPTVGNDGWGAPMR